jgi:NitT/TauT family transport system substrate-binding protein
MFSRTIARLAVGVLLTVALCGCAAKRAPFTIGVNGWPPCEIWYVAEKQGFFGKTPVRIVRFSIWSDNMASLYKGNLDLTHATYLNALYYADKGEKAKIILSSDTILGGDGLVLKASLEGVQALRGGRVAVEVNTDEHFLLRKALDSFGLTEKDISIVSTTSEEAGKMFIEGTVDGCFTYDPFLSDAAAKGGGRIVWTTKDLPGYMTDVLVATEKAIENRRSDLCAVLSAWYKAQDYIRSNPAEAFALMAEKEGMTPEVFTAFYNSFILFSAQENAAIFRAPAFRKILSEMNEFLLSHRAIREPVNIDEAFTTDIVKRVAKAK